MRPSAAEAGAWLAAALLLAATLLWPGWQAERQRAATGRLAEAALERLADAQNGRRAETGRYAPFASAAEREAALPGVELGLAGRLFEFEAAEGPGGALRLRAATRPEALRDGLAAAVLRQVVLDGGAAPGQDHAP